MDVKKAIQLYINPGDTPQDDNWEKVLELAEPVLAKALAQLPEVQEEELGFEEPVSEEEIVNQAILAENIEYFSDENKKILLDKALELI